MGAHSVRGRGTVRTHKGPAKVIKLPVGRARRHRWRNVGIGVMALGALAAGTTLVWLYVLPIFQFAPVLTAGMSEQEAEIMRRVNEEREMDGETPLKPSGPLMLASRGHSYDMALRHYFGHKGPAGDTPAERVRSVGVRQAQVGENLYAEQNGSSGNLAGRAVRKWLNSPEHRANMLSPRFTSTGVGIARSADGTTYVTQDFVN